MRSCPERVYILAFFAPPPPISRENPVMLHLFAYAEIIFAHILVSPACAVEVQHNKEKFPTVALSRNPRNAHPLLLGLSRVSVDLMEASGFLEKK